MIAMTPTITLKGQMKFSLKKALIGGEMAKSVYTGPGELLLAPASIGDITIIKLGGSETWSVGKDAFPTAEVYGPQAGPVLRLVTCGGEFDRATGHYTDNVIAFASAA